MRLRRESFKCDHHWQFLGGKREESKSLPSIGTWQHIDIFKIKTFPFPTISVFINFSSIVRTSSFKCEYRMWTSWPSVWNKDKNLKKSFDILSGNRKLDSKTSFFFKWSVIRIYLSLLRSLDILLPISQFPYLSMFFLNLNAIFNLRISHNLEPPINASRWWSTKNITLQNFFPTKIWNFRNFRNCLKF